MTKGSARPAIFPLQIRAIYAILVSGGACPHRAVVSERHTKLT